MIFHGATVSKTVDFAAGIVKRPIGKMGGCNRFAGIAEKKIQIEDEKIFSFRISKIFVPGAGILGKSRYLNRISYSFPDGSADPGNPSVKRCNHGKDGESCGAGRSRQI
ncbi:hypothetical protein [uncultured Victivallis sp.]|uniref:hypothetical protein n=1 Tax=uncultured Victivallis sp. TaxID=354118 RepID=UPI002593F0F3|nr:hypothetical protein [uncultured Victivallis sp.]